MGLEFQVQGDKVCYMLHSRESGGNKSEMEHLTGGCFKLL